MRKLTTILTLSLLGSSLAIAKKTQSARTGVNTPESRDAYLPHPDHLKVVDLVQPRLERLVVFDFDID